MSTITTTSEKINEALKQKGTIQGKGKNKIITWDVIEDNNFLYRISMSLRSGKIRIEKFIDNEEYINFGRTIIYKAEYDPESENFRIEIVERVLNSNHDGEYTENKYFLSKDHGCLVKKYNDIIVTEYLVGGGGKNFSFVDYDHKNNQANVNFNCNLNADNEFLNGKYSYRTGQITYIFNLGICNFTAAHFYINNNFINKKVQYLGFDSFELDHYANGLKSKVNTGVSEINYFIRDFISKIIEAIKKNPEGREDVIDKPDFNVNFLLDFNEILTSKIKILTLDVPICELYKRINNALSKEKGHPMELQSAKETGPILKKKKM